MKRLRTALQDYLTQRRASGVKLHSAGHALLRFVCFMEKRRCTYITTALAVEWSMQGSRAKSQDLAQAQCLGFVREFAKYMTPIDPRTEIPPYGVLPHPTKHTQPKKKRTKAIGITNSQSAHDLGQAINDYLAMRRALGFKLRLCGNALLDFSSFMQERDAEFANKHRFSKHSPALPLYTAEDATKSLEQIVHFDLHLKAEKESYSTKLAGDGPVTLGITAGASCPNNLIEDTVLRVFQLRGIDEAAVAGVGAVTWRQSKGRQTTDWESVAKDLGATPEQIAARTAEKPGPRTFRFTPV
mgnify:CR=1 FL=1